MTIGLLWDITLAALFILGGLAWFASRDTYRRPLRLLSERDKAEGARFARAVGSGRAALPSLPPRSENSLEGSHGDLPHFGRGDDPAAHSCGSRVTPLKGRA